MNYICCMSIIPADFCIFNRTIIKSYVYILFSKTSHISYYHLLTLFILTTHSHCVSMVRETHLCVSFVHLHICSWISCPFVNTTTTTLHSSYPGSFAYECIFPSHMLCPGCVCIVDVFIVLYEPEHEPETFAQCEMNTSGLNSPFLKLLNLFDGFCYKILWFWLLCQTWCRMLIQTFWWFWIKPYVQIFKINYFRIRTRMGNANILIEPFRK